VTPEEALVELLQVYRDQSRYLMKADRYFRAEPNSVNLGSRIPPALQKFRTAAPLVRVGTMAYADRIRLEDVSLGEDNESAFAEYRGPLKAALQQTILESLAVGTGYLRTIPLSDGTVTYGSVRGRDGAFLEDLDTGELLATMRVHRPRLRRGVIASPTEVTVYMSGSATHFKPATSFLGGWEGTPLGGIPDGVILMRPFVNRARAGEPYGRAELRDLYSIQDQASRALTNLSIATDALAVPQRVLIALQAESLEDLSQVSAYMDSVLALSGDVKIDQWASAQLGPFVEAMQYLARLASAVSGLSVSYWGISSETQGVSGDSIRENDARIEIRATQIDAQFTEPLKSVIRDTQSLDSSLPQDDPVVKWMEPSTYTPTAAADAAVKLASIGLLNGELVVDREMIWNILRVTPEDRARMLEAGDRATLEQLLGQPTGGTGVSNETGGRTPPTQSGNQVAGTIPSGSPGTVPGQSGDNPVD
jgi:hypothetical protein